MSKPSLCLKLVYDLLCYDCIDILATAGCVTVFCLQLKHTIVYFDNRQSKCATVQIINSNYFSLLFLEAVSMSGHSLLIYYVQNFKT